MHSSDDKQKGPDINELRKQHEGDPQIGQGFVDQKGYNPDPPGKKPTHKNIKNNLGPEQKKPRPVREG
jgi:hypothetical protein